MMSSLSPGSRPSVDNAPAFGPYCGWVPAVFFVCLAALRCYLETAVIATPPFFGYFLLCHHLLWFLLIMQCILLLAHLVLEVPVRRTLPIMYGGIVIMIPILWVSIFPDTSPEFEYLSGSPGQIAIYILTFCIAFPQNHALVLELVE